MYKGNWKRRIKAVAKTMTVKILDSNRDWFAGLDFQKPASIPSSKPSTMNHKLTEQQKEHITEVYNSIHASQKWTLSTGKIVDDQMKDLAQESMYEHPVHSLILDPNDPVWCNHFTAAELNEIRQYRRLDLPSIPDDLTVYLDSYDVQWASVKDLYLFAENQQHDPVDEFDKKWVKESILRMAELFLYGDELDLNDFSEADLLHDVWSFIYRAFRDRQMKALLGEVASKAVALAKNKGRGLESKEKRQRKAMGARLDIMFKIGQQEYGTCEVAKDTVTVADDKYENVLREKISINFPSIATRTKAD
ncbi:hypothetical protein RMCBS344292_02951 [Rhizopus microsporus]|nr:hypothetical protein RMCBS344292_02951 [Rhizopus microsporus]